MSPKRSTLWLHKTIWDVSLPTVSTTLTYFRWLLHTTVDLAVDHWQLGLGVAVISSSPSPVLHVPRRLHEEGPVSSVSPPPLWAYDLPTHDCLLLLPDLPDVLVAEALPAPATQSDWQETDRSKNACKNHNMRLWDKTVNVYNVDWILTIGAPLKVIELCQGP